MHRLTEWKTVNDAAFWIRVTRSDLIRQRLKGTGNQMPSIGESFRCLIPSMIAASEAIDSFEQPLKYRGLDARGAVRCCRHVRAARGEALHFDVRGDRLPLPVYR